MIRIGSPFAMLYFYETLEKIDLEEDIIKSIYHNFMPMLEQDATTVWETFSTGTMAFGEFPTRSHCHAWSSAPVYFLNRIILGIKQTSPGGKAFIVSPRLSKLNWAGGATATPLGQVTVDWKKDGGKLIVNIEHPKGVDIKFEKNETMAGLNVKVTKAAV
jgi:alpha-L-rhamnosidase